MPVLRKPVTSRQVGAVSVRGECFPVLVDLCLHPSERRVGMFQALWFRPHRGQPELTTLPTAYVLLHDDPSESRPSFEEVLGSNNIHDCWVEHRNQAGHIQRFLIGFKPLTGSGLSGSLRRILPTAPPAALEGELVVMCAGERRIFVKIGRNGAAVRQAVRM